MPFDLEFSLDYGQTWLSIDRPSSVASSSNDIIVTQPLRAMRTRFYLPLHTYRSIAKSVNALSRETFFFTLYDPRFLRVRWLASNSSLAQRWQISNATIRSECELICEVDPCHGTCSCSQRANCSLSTRKRTFAERFNGSSSTQSDMITLPPLNLVSTRYVALSLRLSPS